MKIWYFLVIILNICPKWIFGADDTDDVIGSLFKTQVSRVDKDVKRPVRFCQGFEDPAEIDCYMRSDIKPYVCTEPVAFNPCESLQRVETYHYDHITHRCVKVNVPACEGQIIRALSLIQCLIYCHNKDPFALGKSKSMVYKLNQPKPYVPNEKVEVDRGKILNKTAKKSFSTDEDMANKGISNPKIINQITKYATQSYINKVTSDIENNENAEKKNVEELSLRKSNGDVRVTNVPNLNHQNENSKESEVNEIDKKENEDDEDLKREDGKAYPSEIDKEIVDDENKNTNKISKLMEKIHQTDSTEKGKDDGFYLWDE